MCNWFWHNILYIIYIVILSPFFVNYRHAKTCAIAMEAQFNHASDHAPEDHASDVVGCSWSATCRWETMGGGVGLFFLPFHEEFSHEEGYLPHGAGAIHTDPRSSSGRKNVGVTSQNGSSIDKST